MFLLVSLLKSKLLTRVAHVSFEQHSCPTYVAPVSLVSQSRRSCVASVALVLHTCHQCRTRVARVWHSCCKLDQIIKTNQELIDSYLQTQWNTIGNNNTPSQKIFFFFVFFSGSSLSWNIRHFKSSEHVLSVPHQPNDQHFLFATSAIFLTLN